MNDNGKHDSHFTLGSFLLRFLVALILVLVTYNPSPYSFVRWLQAAISEGQAGAIHALAGVILLIGWTVFLRSAWASLGTLGLVLGGAFLAALVWVLIDYDVVAIESRSTIVWIVLVCLAGLLAIGMSWAHWKRRASGQVEVDEVER
jgi:hypothetical protein